MVLEQPILQSEIWPYAGHSFNIIAYLRKSSRFICMIQVHIYIYRWRKKTNITILVQHGIDVAGGSAVAAASKHRLDFRPLKVLYCRPARLWSSQGRFHTRSWPRHWLEAAKLACRHKLLSKFGLSDTMTLQSNANRNPKGKGASHFVLYFCWLGRGPKFPKYSRRPGVYPQLLTSPTMRARP